MNDFKNILIAHDNEIDIDNLYRAIKNIYRYARVVFFYNGDQCLNYLKADQPADLIFLDDNMLFFNGRECMTWISGNEHYKKVPVVIMADKHSNEDMSYFLNSGAAFYAARPATQLAYNILLSKIFSPHTVFRENTLA